MNGELKIIGTSGGDLYRRPIPTNTIGKLRHLASSTPVQISLFISSKPIVFLKLSVINQKSVYVTEKILFAFSK